MTTFINEGVKVFYKIIYGLCMILKDQLLATTTPEEIENVFLNSHIDKDIKSTDILF